MSKFGFKIYGLFDPTTKELRYIGKTQARLSSRLAHHIWRANHDTSNYHKKQWILKLQKKGLRPEIDVLEKCSSNEELIEAEMFHISYWRSLGCNLVNHTLGGEGCVGYKHTEEVKRDISERQKGKIVPESVCVRLRQLNPEQEQEVVKLYVSGLSCKDVGVCFNMSGGGIRKVLMRHGVELRPCYPKFKITTEEEIKAINLYNSGATLKSIGESLGYFSDTIKRALARNGVRIQKRTENAQPN